ncbi:type II secretion system protein GspM [Escherichia coli]|nr:type II secretion system protein GspM [Escherichia coli]
MAARKSGTTTQAQVSRVISDSGFRALGGHQADSRAWGEYSGLIEPVVFNDLLKWLNALDEKYALRVTQIDVSAAEKPGMVNVLRLEFDGVGIAISLTPPDNP